MAQGDDNGIRSGNLPPSRWATALLVAVLSLIGALPFGAECERVGSDLLFRLRGPRPTSARIVVVAVDEATHKLWGDTPFALSAGHFAALIDRVRNAGAAIVGLDIVPEFDADRFYGTMHIPGTPPNSRLVQTLDAAGERHILIGAIPPDHLPSPEIRWAVASGQLDNNSLDLRPDPDGVVRRGVLSVNVAGTAVPGFAPLLAAWASPPPKGRPITPADLTPTATIPDRGAVTIPINYVGRAWPVLSATDVLHDSLNSVQRAALQNAIVLIGDTSPAAQDSHPTPYGPSRPGVLIHADLIATLLDDCSLRFLPSYALPLLTLLAGTLALGALLWLPPRWSIALCIAGAALWFGGVLAALHANILMPYALPVTTLLASPLLYLAVRSAEERLRWIALKAALGPYLSPGICEYLLESEENRRPGGRTTEATCLFLDIRDSVRYGASHSPDTVMQDLNELFFEIVPAIDAAGGQICKYTGDGLLAVFGVPRPFPEDSPNHAEAALHAIRGIGDAVARVNERRQARSLEIWRVGCGLNSGIMVFGNLGTVQRPEFTLIGDTVNVAARLEGLSRSLAERAGRQPVLSAVLSEDTFQRLRQKPPVGPRQIEEIRGHGPLAVYLLSDP